MNRIEQGKKYQDGVQVSWSETGTEQKEFFTYEELIGMKINVLDLIYNPGIYLVDPGHHLIASSV